VGNQGRRFTLPHLFLLRVNPDGRIAHISSYYDQATMNRQLGWLEVD
jgi:ketosteroid isomerase-like protein